MKTAAPKSLTARLLRDIEQSKKIAPLVEEVRPDDELLTTEEAAKIIKISSSWLEKQRTRPDGPPYHKRGRVVRYVRREIIGWMIGAKN